MKTKPFHEAANLFPLDEEHIDELAADIRKNGLLYPIEMCDEQVLDGRRRWLACEKADVEPDMIEVTPDDPVAHVLSLNLHRRQLTPGQKAMVGDKAREMYDKAAKERQGERTDQHPGKFAGKSDAREAAGKAVGVSGRTMDYAARVRKDGIPELIAAVEEGRVAVSTAAIMVNEPEDVQREWLASRKR